MYALRYTANVFTGCQNNHGNDAKSPTSPTTSSPPVGPDGYHHLHEHQIAPHRRPRGSSGSHTDDVYYSDIDQPAASRRNNRFTSYSDATTVPVNSVPPRVPSSLKQTKRNSGMREKPAYNRSKSEGNMYHSLEPPIQEDKQMEFIKRRSKLSLDSGVEPDYADVAMRSSRSGSVSNEPGRPQSQSSCRDCQLKSSSKISSQVRDRLSLGSSTAGNPMDGCDTLGYLVVLPTEDNNTNATTGKPLMYYNYIYR